MTINTTNMPDDKGYFGEYGGQILPPPMIDIMNQINDAYDEVTQTKAFQDELNELYADYVGRPSPIYFARRLT
ncbi:MAG: tryptophan synthase subunit beta, partial [Ghiorsea sp.]|nr:tryptophan synthase subunit beta [Ghiorsea sp.]